MGTVDPLDEEQAYIDTERGNGLTVQVAAFGDDMQYLVSIESTSGAATLFALTATQARELAARLVGQAMKLEPTSSQGWVDGAVTIGRILFPDQDFKAIAKLNAMKPRRPGGQ